MRIPNSWRNLTGWKAVVAAIFLVAIAGVREWNRYKNRNRMDEPPQTSTGAAHTPNETSGAALGPEFVIDGIASIPTPAGFTWTQTESKKLNGFPCVVYKATNENERETVLAVTILQASSSTDETRLKMLKAIYAAEKENFGKQGVTIAQENPPPYTLPIAERVEFSFTLTKVGIERPANVMGTVLFRNNTYVCEYFSAISGRAGQLIRLAADIKDLTPVKNPVVEPSSVANSDAKTAAKVGSSEPESKPESQPKVAVQPIIKPEDVRTLMNAARAAQEASSTKTADPSATERTPAKPASSDPALPSVNQTPATNKSDIRTTRIPADAQRLLQHLIWSADGLHLYTLTRDGLLQRFSLPKMQESQRIQLDGAYTFLGLSRQGLVVARQDKTQIVNLDVEQLQARQAISVDEVSYITCTPSSSIVYISKWGTLQAVDLRDGSAYSPRIESASHKQLGRDFRGLKLSPDGKTIYSGLNEINQSSTDGSTVVVLQSSPRISGGSSGVVLSEDAKKVALPDGGGNQSDGFPTVAYGTYVFSTADLHSPILALSTGAYPRVVGFDLVTGNVYAQNHETPLIVYSDNGQKLAEYKFGQGSVRNFVVHPLGRRLCVLTDRELMFVELPESDSIPIRPRPDPYASLEEPERPRLVAGKDIPSTDMASKKQASNTPKKKGVAKSSESPPRSAPKAQIPKGFRTWTDPTGKFKVIAKFRETTDEKVVLEKEDGSTIEVPINRLSDLDQRQARQASASANQQ